MQRSSQSDNGISIIDGITMMSTAIAGPLVIGWVLKNPRENIKTTFTLLNAVRNIVATFR